MLENDPNNCPVVSEYAPHRYVRAVGLVIASAAFLALLAGCASVDGRTALLQSCKSWSATLDSAASLNSAGAMSPESVALVNAWQPTVSGVCLRQPPTEEGAGAAADVVKQALRDVAAGGVN